jgi:hypothetical protein
MTGLNNYEFSGIFGLAPSVFKEQDDNIVTPV